MAHYIVTAEPVENKMDELHKKLKENEFINLKPFGKSLTFSLKNARKKNENKIVWEEEDYCLPR